MSQVGSGFQIGLSWVPLKKNKIPTGAIQLQEGFYVARGEVQGQMIPGRYVAARKLCSLPYDGKEVQLKDCEILCDTSVKNYGPCYKWVWHSLGFVPYEAIVCGLDKNGRAIYICRHKIENDLCVGKITDGQKCGYVPYGGTEREISEYEVLVLNN